MNNDICASTNIPITLLIDEEKSDFILNTDALGLHFVHLTTYSIHYRQLQLLHPSSNSKTQLTPEIVETRTF